MTSLDEQLDPLADEIQDYEVATLAGLRTTLVGIYRAMPGTAQIDHDTLCEMGETDQRSLLVAAAEITGLDPLVDYIEDRVAVGMGKVASCGPPGCASVLAAGGCARSRSCRRAVTGLVVPLC